MRPFIIGTAGHVDHGKTSLIRALTGVHTDRLQEEQSRGITIELGFAPLKLGEGPDAVQAGIIDVPGHERFVKHMVAGAGGVDLVMMVVAADEGVMPQTREHLDICRLLDVHAGIVVLTKVDLVDEDWIDLVEEDLRESLVGTFLEGAPIVRFSTEAEDPAAQRAAIFEAILATRVATRDTDALFRQPVDRVFTLRGHGTVITGTVVGGRLSVGDDVTLIPGDVQSRVRSLQSFGDERREVEAGMRVAVNLPGVEKDQLHRGMVVVRKNTIAPTDIVDVWLRHLPHAPRPLADGSAAILHIGSAHTNARVRVLESAPIQPGDEGLVRLHLDEPVVALPGDRFILRGYADLPGHGKTLAGGEVIHLSGGPYRLRYKGARLRTYLREIAAADERERLRLVLRSVGHDGLDAIGLATRTGYGPARIQTLIDALVSSRDVLPVEEQPRLYLDGEELERLAVRILDMVRGHLDANPLEEGLAREEIRSQIRPAIRPKVLTAILERMRDDGLVTVAREHVGLPGREVRLDGEDAALGERILGVIREGGLAPPRVDTLSEALDADAVRIRDIVALLARRGDLVRVADGLFYLPETVTEVQERLVAHLEEHGEITTQTFKEITGLTRRWLIPLAEHFDHAKVTIRRGEVRVLRAVPQQKPR